MLLLLALAGCDKQDAIEVVSGEALSPEEQELLYDQRVELQTLPAFGDVGTVYWTPKGTKYHTSMSCIYLENAKQVQSGTVAEAINHGTEGPCSRCGKG